MRIPEQKLRRKLTRCLANGFDRLILENRAGALWELRLEPHPETGAPALLAEQGERKDLHPPEQLPDLVVELSRAGFIKHAWIIDARTRLLLDARYAKIREKVLDTAVLQKISGGRADPLRPDNAAELLRVLGLMSPSGAIAAKEKKKLKQVNDFTRLIEPMIERIRARPGRDSKRPVAVADLACGNSYLSFVLAWDLRARAIPGTILGIDRRAELVTRSQERARSLGYSEMEHRCAAISEAPLAGTELVLALHACYTASDDAIIAAVRANAEVIMVVPCCQNELFLQLSDAAAPFPELCTESLLRRAFAAVLTDSLRALALEASGYKVAVLDFTAALHTTKSLMLRATKAPRPKAALRQQFFDACARHSVRPSIARLFDEPATPAP